MATVNLGLLGSGGGGGVGITSLTGDVTTAPASGGVAYATVQSVNGKLFTASATPDTAVLRDASANVAFNGISAAAVILTTPSTMAQAAVRYDQLIAAVATGSLEFYPADGIELNTNLSNITNVDWRGHVLSDGHVVTAGDMILLAAQGDVTQNLLWECSATNGYFVRPTGWEIGVDITAFRIPIIDYTALSNRDGWIYLQSNNGVVIGTAPPAPAYTVIAKGGSLHGDGTTIIQPTGTTLSVGVIQTGNIANGAITAFKLGTGAVQTQHIQNGAVDASKIGTGAVGATELGSAAVQNDKIQNGAVDAAKLGTAAVTAAKIQDGAVTSTKIGALAVTDDKIALATITNDRMVDATLTGTKMAAGTITQTNLAANSVGTINIIDASVTGAKIATGTISGSNLVNFTITDLQIAAGAVYGNRLADSGIATSKYIDSSVTLAKLDSVTVYPRLIPAVAGTTAQYLSGVNTYLPLISNAGASAANTVLVADATGTFVQSSLLSFAQYMAQSMATVTKYATYVLGGTPSPNTVGSSASPTNFIIPMATFTASQNTGLSASITVSGTATAWSIVIAPTTTTKIVEIEMDLRAVFGGGTNNNVASFEYGFSSTGGVVFTHVPGASTGFAYNEGYNNAGGGIKAWNQPTKARMTYSGTTGGTFYAVHTGFSEFNGASSTTVTINSYSTGTTQISYLRIKEIG